MRCPADIHLFDKECQAFDILKPTITDETLSVFTAYNLLFSVQKYRTNCLA